MNKAGHNNTITISATAAYSPKAQDDNETLDIIVSKHKHTEETTLGTNPVIWVRLWDAMKIQMLR